MSIIRRIFLRVVSWLTTPFSDDQFVDFWIWGASSMFQVDLMDLNKCLDMDLTVTTFWTPDCKAR